ncbi:hypothetical protein [Streptomyces sp. WM6378]|uniref:hypothetical protein n=1 Tax=Streptomyces sp. WM6378 TaxID=1415557 RepID=UPI0006B043A5|nr:hypothetical protein [Streptomyces sp. WM6378]
MRPTSPRPHPPLWSISPLDQVESAFLSLAAEGRPLTVPVALSADSDTVSPLCVTRVRARMVHPSCTEQARAGVWNEILRRRALLGEPWGTVAVGLTLPALRRTLSRLPRLAEVEACELEQEVLAAVTAELALLTTDEPQAGLRLVRAGDRAAHRLLYAAQRTRRIEAVALDENAVPRPCPPAAWRRRSPCSCGPSGPGSSPRGRLNSSRRPGWSAR